MRIFQPITIVLILVLANFSYSQTTSTGGFFEANGTNIHFIVAGSGEAVVLYHGFTSDASSWVRAGVFDSLATDYRVIAIDARGHGESDKPHSIESYGIEMSNDVVRLLDHLEIEKAHVIGYSMGARIIGRAVASDEDRFLSAIFGGAAPDWEWPEDLQREVEAGSEKMINSPPQRVIDRGQDNLALGLATLSQSENVVPQNDLVGLEIPLMTIVGSEDIGFDGVKAFGDMLPNMRFVVIDGAEHVGPKGALGDVAFIRSVSEFLEESRSQNRMSQ